MSTTPPDFDPVLSAHPFALEYPRATEEDAAIIEKDMRSSKYDERFPVVLYGGMILDGVTRYSIATKLGINPTFCTFEGTEVEAKAFVARANENRRHLDKQWLIERRRERVAESRVNGESIRAIAETENVSKSTVENDLRVSGVQGVDTCPQNGKITGKDDKEYPLPPPKPEPILCERCKRNKRTGQPPVKGCSMCKELRPASPPKSGSNGAKTDSKPAPVDAFGTEIPKRCRDAYCDPWIQESIDYLGVLIAEFWKTRLADGITKRKKAFPFFNVKDFVDGCGMIGNTAEQLLEHLKENRPAGVCPSCEGKGCSDCRSSGLVSRKEYERLKKAVKK